MLAVPNSCHDKYKKTQILLLPFPLLSTRWGPGSHGLELVGLHRWSSKFPESVAGVLSLLRSVYPPFWSNTPLHISSYVFALCSKCKCMMWYNYLQICVHGPLHCPLHWPLTGRWGLGPHTAQGNLSLKQEMINNYLKSYDSTLTPRIQHKNFNIKDHHYPPVSYDNRIFFATGQLKKRQPKYAAKLFMPKTILNHKR